MSEQPPGVNITVSPSQIGGWSAMTLVFRDDETDDVLRTVEGGNLPLPGVGERVSFGNVTTVAEDAGGEPTTNVDMDPSAYEVVDREFTYVYRGSTASAGSSEVEVTVDVSLRETG